METMRDILDAVATGQLDADQAADQIAALRERQRGSDLEPSPIQDILVKAGGARLVVIADPSVSEAVVEGSHRVQRDGHTLVITTNAGEGDYSAAPPRSALLNWLTSVVDRAGQTLTVRVNPALPLRVLIVGGTLDLTGGTAGTSVGVEAGSARLGEGSGPLQVDVVSGSAKVDWTFDAESTVKVDMGSAQVRVRPDSNVRITAEAGLGQAVVKTDEAMHKADGESATPEVVVGSGAGTLHAAARMGSVQVTVG